MHTEVDVNLPPLASAPEAGTFQPAVTFLNGTGDITITWDEHNKDAVLAMVRKKMQQGYSFFTVKPMPLLPFIKYKSRVTSPSDLRNTNNVVLASPNEEAILKRLLDDEDVADAFKNGKVYSTGRSAESFGQASTLTRRVTRAEEVLTQQTVAVRPIAGG